MNNQHNIQLGIIGGSGLYQMKDLQIIDEIKMDTPFGSPSDDLLIGKLANTTVAFLPRHAKGHKILPSELNFRANIAAFKILGCEQIVSVSAVGSLRQHIEPGHFVMIDQFIDRTFNRVSSYFGDGLVAHVSFAEPICATLRQQLVSSGKNIGASVHEQGTYLCMEGPLFSTKAESHLYQSWGADVIGMTNLQEAKLAREAQMCYATIALSTDYDCWHEGHESVTTDMIIKTLNQNVSKAQQLIKDLAKQISNNSTCACRSSLKHAIITDKNSVPSATLKKLAFMLPKNYLS